MKKFGGKDLVDVLLASLYAVLVSIVAVMIFALVLNWTNVSDKVIDIVNIAIKIVSIVVGCVLGIRHNRGGIVKGVAVGTIFGVLSWVVFSLIVGEWTWGMSELIDLLCGIGAGTISGIVVVNVKKSK